MQNKILKYSICTLVTSWTEYEKMKASFLLSGFTEEDCEYLTIDNANDNTYDAYNGLNNLKDKARGEFIIFCHQDILLFEKSRNNLELKIKELETTDLYWGVLANCGARKPKQYALRVLEGDGKIRDTKNFPMKVYSVDEHFFMIRNIKELKFSNQWFEGFHLYGTDMCFKAMSLGYSCYAIDFCLQHFGQGDLNSSFYVTKQKFIQSYHKTMPLGWVQTTCTRMYISTYPWFNKLMNSNLLSYISKKYYQYFYND